MPEATSVTSVSELTATSWISRRRLCSSDLAEMFLCNVKILQKPLRELNVCRRCFFQMLNAPAKEGVVVFSSLYRFPEVEVEWVDALSFRVGAILKANRHPPHSKTFYPTTSRCSRSESYNIQKGAVLLRSRWQWRSLNSCGRWNNTWIQPCDSSYMKRCALVSGSLGKYGKHSCGDYGNTVFITVWLFNEN